MRDCLPNPVTTNCVHLSWSWYWSIMSMTLWITPDSFGEPLTLYTGIGWLSLHLVRWWQCMSLVSMKRPVTPHCVHFTCVRGLNFHLQIDGPQAWCSGNSILFWKPALLTGFVDKLSRRGYIFWIAYSTSRRGETECIPKHSSTNNRVKWFEERSEGMQFTHCRLQNLSFLWLPF